MPKIETSFLKLCKNKQQDPLLQNGCFLFYYILFISIRVMDICLHLHDLFLNCVSSQQLFSLKMKISVVFLFFFFFFHKKEVCFSFIFFVLFVFLNEDSFFLICSWPVKNTNAHIHTLKYVCTYFLGKFGKTGSKSFNFKESGSIFWFNGV